ncbi:MAG: carbon-nitrogen hydrolase family protein, partial [Isosphaeraceae bacterium]
MKIQAAAIQMPCDILDLPTNLQRADELIRTARDAGSELVVLPELFNTGYSLCPDFGPCSETAEGPTLSYLRQRSRRWKMAIAAGFVERAGRHLFDSLAFCTPDGEMQIYRKRNLVFWERSRFHPGRAPLVVSTPFGRVGLGVCAD